MLFTKTSFLFIVLFSCTRLHAQVAVREEPHHKPVLENEYVRLLDVHIKPGDTTLYHIHAAPSVIVYISNSQIGSQQLNKQVTQPNEVKPAQTSFIDYEQHPITHRVYNAGNNIFHVMDIELVKQNPLSDSCVAWQQPGAKITINEKLVRVYCFDVSNKASALLQKNNCAHLLVCVAGAISIADKQMATGDYLFFNPETPFVINNHQKDSSTCVLLELK